MATEVDSVQMLWDLAKNASAFAVPLTLWLYLRSDLERRALNKELLDLTKSTTTLSETWTRILERSQLGRLSSPLSSSPIIDAEDKK